MKKTYVVKVTLPVLRSLVSAHSPMQEKENDVILKKYGKSVSLPVDAWEWRNLENASYEDVMYLIKLLGIDCTVVPGWS
jgi:hypothetical protein